MVGTFWRWLRFKLTNTPQSDVKRGIFRFWDGKKVRSVDPMATDARLQKHGGKDWSELLATINAADNAIVKPGGALAAEVERSRHEAVEKLVQLVRDAFSIADVENGGLSSSECVEVMARYLAFIVAVKERFHPLPSSPARLAPSSDAQAEAQLLPSTFPETA